MKRKKTPKIFPNETEANVNSYTTSDERMLNVGLANVVKVFDEP